MSSLRIWQIIEKREWLLFLPLALLTHSAFILSTDLLVDETSALLGDSWLIHNLAKSYSEEGKMLLMGEYTLYQFPIYPFFISLFYSFNEVDPRYVLWVQVCSSIIFINLTVVITRETLKGWRFLFGVLLCFDLHQLLYSSCLLTEFWVMLFWFFAILSFMKYRKSKKMRWWILTFSIFTFTSNIKPLSLFIPLFMSFGLGIFDSFSIKRNIKLTLVSLLVYGLGMMPLLYRNYLISDQFPLLTTNSALGVWYYNIPYVKSGVESRSIKEIRLEHVEMMRQALIQEGKTIPQMSEKEALSRHGHRKALGLNEFEYAKLANQFISEYLKENFFTYVKYHLISGLNLFTISNMSWLKVVYSEYDAVSFGQLDLKTIQEWFLNSNAKLYLLLSRIYELAFTFGLLLFAILGTVILILKKQFTALHWICWLVVIYVTCVTGVNAWGRFRFLFMPVIIYLGVEGIKLIFDQIYLRKRLAKAV